jgi:hypothetical protein
MTVDNDHGVETDFDLAPFIVNAMNKVPEIDHALTPVNWMLNALGVDSITREDIPTNQHLVAYTNSVTDTFSWATLLNVMEFGFTYTVSWQFDVLT